MVYFYILLLSFDLAWNVFISTYSAAIDWFMLVHKHYNQHHNFPFAQEVGNVSYVVDNGAGVFSEDPREAARQVARWFSTDMDELKIYSRKALQLADPEAVFEIIKDIHKLQQQSVTVTQIYSLTSSFSYHIWIRGYHYSYTYSACWRFLLKTVFLSLGVALLFICVNLIWLKLLSWLRLVKL